MSLKHLTAAFTVLLSSAPSILEGAMGTWCRGYPAVPRFYEAIVGLINYSQLPIAAGFLSLMSATPFACLMLDAVM